jgi:hypothetical protein
MPVDVPAGDSPDSTEYRDRPIMASDFPVHGNYGAVIFQQTKNNRKIITGNCRSIASASIALSLIHQDLCCHIKLFAIAR